MVQHVPVLRVKGICIVISMNIQSHSNPILLRQFHDLPHVQVKLPSDTTPAALLLLQALRRSASSRDLPQLNPKVDSKCHLTHNWTRAPIMERMKFLLFFSRLRTIGAVNENWIFKGSISITSKDTVYEDEQAQLHVSVFHTSPPR